MNAFPLREDPLPDHRGRNKGWYAVLRAIGRFSPGPVIGLAATAHKMPEGVLSLESLALLVVQPDGAPQSVPLSQHLAQGPVSMDILQAYAALAEGDFLLDPSKGIKATWDCYDRNDAYDFRELWFLPGGVLILDTLHSDGQDDDASRWGLMLPTPETAHAALQLAAEAETARDLLRANIRAYVPLLFQENAA